MRVRPPDEPSSCAGVNCSMTQHARAATGQLIGGRSCPSRRGRRRSRHTTVAARSGALVRVALRPPQLVVHLARLVAVAAHRAGRPDRAGRPVRQRAGAADHTGRWRILEGMVHGQSIAGGDTSRVAASVRAGFLEPLQRLDCEPRELPRAKPTAEADGDASGGEEARRDVTGAWRSATIGRCRSARLG